MNRYRVRIGYDTGQYTSKTVEVEAGDEAIAEAMVRQMADNDWAFWDNAYTETGDPGDTEVFSIVQLERPL